jgi:hypothetical protein
MSKQSETAPRSPDWSILALLAAMVVSVSIRLALLFLLLRAPLSRAGATLIPRPHLSTKPGQAQNLPRL